jgi:4-alpha-glucanotransferase
MHENADDLGVAAGYEDNAGGWRPTPDATRALVRAAMRLDDPAAANSEEVRVLTRAELSGCSQPGRLALEDGGRLATDALPPDVPWGYHRFESADGRRPEHWIVAPDACWLPDDLFTWGWAVQLYAARSRQSWGLGDLADLRTLGRWSRDIGAGILLVSPMPAVAPAAEQEASPYYPSSRRFLNPLYLAVEEIPGANTSGLDLAALAAAGRRLNEAPQIDRAAVFRLKTPALEKIFRATVADSSAFDAACDESLRRFATFCTLAERHGSDWRHWPAEFRRAESSAVADYRAEHAERVRFHAWLQQQLAVQLARAGREIKLVQDLPIGFDPGGADAWEYQDLLAEDVTVGAPPDFFNAQGQNWGLPAFVPRKLRAAAYVPFRDTIRTALRNSGGLRIDHAVGLFRLFWIPRDCSAADGAYVYYPSEDLLRIVALESQRAQAFIIGEDLGTVGREVRSRLAANRMLSYRLLWFEHDPPEQYPELSLASATTHDLPTAAGLWDGSDADEQLALGVATSRAAAEELRARLAGRLGLGLETPVSQVIEAIHAQLARSRSRLVTATLEDAVAERRRPNVPSTTRARRANWRLPLPMPLEELELAPLPRQIARVLSDRHMPPAG